jgi:hypothetical protein
MGASCKVHGLPGRSTVQKALAALSEDELIACARNG